MFPEPSDSIIAAVQGKAAMPHWEAWSWHVPHQSSLGGLGRLVCEALSLLGDELGDVCDG